MPPFLPARPERSPSIRSTAIARRLLIALAAALAPLSALDAREARPGPRAIPIEPTLVGYNIGTWRDGPGWDDERLRASVRKLRPGNLRYPGGTVANYWDWRTGTVLDYIDSGTYRYDPSRPTMEPADVARNVSADTAIVYVVNMARVTAEADATRAEEAANPDSLAVARAKGREAVAALEAFRDAGRPVRYVSLGNEFYQDAKGGLPGQGGIYTAEVERYVAAANAIAAQIDAHDPTIEIGVIGEATSGGEAITPWTAAVYAAIAEGRLTNVDGVTFHWYSGPGDLAGLSGADAAEKSLSQAQKAAGAVRRDLDSLPDGLDAWSEEYNTFSSPKRDEAGRALDKSGIVGGPIQGTWTNGLFTALLTLRYAALDPRIEMLTVHNLATGNNVQWNMLYTPGTLSGNGVAMGAIARAFRGRTELRELEFEGLEAPDTRYGTPSVYGVRLSGGDGEALAIINATRRAVPGLDVGASLLRGGRYQVEQHHDRTPMSKASDDRVVRAGRGGGIASRWRDLDGERIDLPPFSVTVVRSIGG